MDKQETLLQGAHDQYLNILLNITKRRTKSPSAMRAQLVHTRLAPTGTGPHLQLSFCF